MTAGALRDKGSHEELTQKVTDLQEQVRINSRMEALVSKRLLHGKACLMGFCYAPQVYYI